MKGKIVIIGGMLKNSRIESYDSPELRPLLSRVKKSLFDILTPRLAGSVFLDLFCGTGTVGLEACSRGAAKTVFVDQSAMSERCIAGSIERFGLALSCEHRREDCLSFLRSEKRRFDLVFSGPPYFSGLNVPVSELLDKNRLLSPGGLAVFQQHKSEPDPCGKGGLLMCREERYGDMRLIFYENRNIPV